MRILAELYEIDPALKGSEKDLIPVIELLLSHNPGRAPDAEFVEDLRRHLREKAATLNQPSPSSSPFSLFPMSNLFYLLGGAVAAVVITVPTVQYLSAPAVPGDQPSDRTATPLFSYSVSEAGNKAFGDLSKGVPGGAPAMGRGQGGGGGPIAPMAAENAATPQQATSDVDAARGSDSNMMIDPFYPPEIVTYDYVLSAPIPELTEDTVPVYKRDKKTTRIPLSSLASTFNLGLMDLKSFADANADSINFYQDKPFGYNISVQLREGMVNISQNWEQWPQPELNCRDEACYRRMQVNIHQLLPDATLIDLATKFVEEHGIDMSKYGTPEVDTTWKIEYDRAPDKQFAYVPERQQVIFPLLVDGQPVYEEWGGKSGISVSVDVREKKVADVWGLMSQNLVKSSYDAVTDAAEVEKFVKTIDQTPAEYMPKDAKKRTVKITLGAPTESLVKFYLWNEGDMQGQELMVPALVFPVESVDGEEYYYRRNVVVPLAADVLKSRMDQNRYPVMPMAEPTDIENAPVEVDSSAVEAR
jgi:hypothetical protein